MANRPFTIQDNAISLNGVEISAAVDGKVVIPGITASAGYVVEEVEDTGDQPRTWTAPTVIDNARYDFLVGTYAGTGYTPAEYLVELDDDGYIDNIRVNVPGILPATDTAELDVDYMWATDVADPLASFVGSDWVQIPFKTKIRASTIEADPTSPVAGGGVVEREVNFPYGEPGDMRGTLALTPDSHLYICTADYEATEPLEFSYETNQDYDIGQTSGQYIIFTGAGNGGVPELEAIFGVYLGGAYFHPTPSEFVVEVEGVDGARTCVQAGYNLGGEPYLEIEYVAGDDTSFPTGTQVNVVYTASQSGAIWQEAGSTTIDRLTNGNGAEFLLDGSGNILMPENGAIWFNYGYIDQDSDEDSNALRISGGEGVTIKASEDGTTWRFNDNGTVTFPDGSIQSTAYTGQQGGGSSGELYIMANVDGNVTTSTDGIQWGPSQLSGMASIERAEVHGGVIVYIPSMAQTGLYYSTSIGTVTLCTGTNNLGGPDVRWREVHFFHETDTWVAVGNYFTNHSYPIVAHSTNGIAWTVVPVDISWVDSYNTNNSNWYLNDVIYDVANGTYVISSYLDDGAIKGGIFVTSDITTALNGSNHVDIGGNIGPLAPFPVEGYGGPPGFIIAIDADTGNSLWTGYGTDPTNWITGFFDWENACTNQLGYIPPISEIAYNGTNFIIATEEGQVGIPVIGMGIYFLISVPLPYTNTDFSISNANPAVITFNGTSAINNEKIEVTGAGEYNGTYYVNTGTGVLYTDQAMSVALDASGFAAFVSGTVTFSHGTYFDAAGTANSYYFLGNDDEQIFRSTNSGQTWTQVQDITGDYFNDFGYGTFGAAVLDLTDVQTDLVFTQENKGRFAKIGAANDTWIDCVDIDLNGHTYTTGGAYPNDWDDQDPTICKFDAEGQLLWKKAITFDNDYSNKPSFTRVKFYKDYVYVLGYMYVRSTQFGLYGEDRSFIFKLDASNGEIVDNNTWYWSGSPGNDMYLYDLDFLTDDTPVAVGTTYGGGHRIKYITPAKGQQNTVWFTTSDLYNAPAATIYPGWWRSVKLFGGELSEGGESLTPFQIFDVPTQTVTGTGSGLRVNVELGYAQDGDAYLPNGYSYIQFVTWSSGGTGYVTGDTVKVLGTYLGGTSPENDLTFNVYADENASGVAYSYDYNSKTGTPPTDIIPFSTWHDVNFSGTVGVSETYEIGFIASNGAVVVSPNWQANFNGPTDSYDWAHSIAVASGGGILSNDRIFVPTAMRDGANDYRNVVNVLNGEGSIIDQVIIDSGDINNYQDAGTVAVDSSANSYYSFIDYNGDDDTEAVCVVKLNNSLELVARVRQNNANSDWDGVPTITVDGVDNVYIGGAGYDEVLSTYVWHAIKLNSTTLDVDWNKAIRSTSGYNPYNWYWETGANIKVSEDWIHCVLNRYNGNRDRGYLFLLPNNATDIADTFFVDDDTWVGEIGHITFGSNAFLSSGYEAGESNTNVEAQQISNPFNSTTTYIPDYTIVKTEDLSITNLGIENVNHITFTDGTTLSTGILPTRIADWTNPQTENEWWMDTYKGAWSGNLPTRFPQDIYFTVAIGYENNDYVVVDATSEQVLQFCRYPERYDIDEFSYQMSFDDGVTWYSIGPDPDDENAEGKIGFNFYDWKTDEYTSRHTTAGQTVLFRYYTGRPKVWFDVANAPSGYRYFRGAKIDYHAYVQDLGTIIGTIHISNDNMGQRIITHTEAVSGHEDLNKINLWLMNDWRTSGDKGILVQGFPYWGGNIAVQWTATMFHGRDYWGD